MFKGHFFNNLLKLASGIERTIAFSDGNDVRLIKALDYFSGLNNSRYILVGDQTEIQKKIKEVNPKNLKNFIIADPEGPKTMKSIET